MCWLMSGSATLMDEPDPKATSGAKFCSEGPPNSLKKQFKNV